MSSPCSTPKKRLKSKHTKPNSPSIPLLKEPSPGFFPTKQEIINLLGVITIAIAVAVTFNYIATNLNCQPKPYCDSIDRVVSDDYSLLSDDLYCEPCPENGECVDGNLECVSGYKKQGRLCVEDGEISQIAKELSKWIEVRVCEAAVGCLCDGIGEVWVQEAQVFKEIADKQDLKRKLGLKNDDSYVLTKQKAMESVDRLLETRKNLQGRVKELKCPDALVEHYKPLFCYVRHWVIKNAFYLVPVCALIGGLMTSFVWLLGKVRRRRYLSNRVEELYEQICDILQEKAVMAKSAFTGEGEPWVVASWLRDDLLLPRERKDALLWKKVEELVQEDSRLDQYPKLVRGESKVVWEWQVEGSLSSSRSRTKGKGSKQTPNGRLPNSPASIQTPSGRLPNSHVHIAASN
ncbi:hypothetical protein C5167_003925 [Papaver somniferum]|uniref:uncharacterized protein LOC113344517 n=1 Tax=Papaver somniferum TaxID=3469 RepID=UPI000E6FCC8C|nr:uncharacterized protein LOC113344517 [Papaver somniferum]RZC93559.1 hypothetical protein C5167_003925 [Papaver somniferum]